jgi:hypothetical protein
MSRIEKKSMNLPDETRTFDKGKIELIKIGDASVGRIYLEPGWSWEKCPKPIVKTESCQADKRAAKVSFLVPSSCDILNIFFSPASTLI